MATTLTAFLNRHSNRIQETPSAVNGRESSDTISHPDSPMIERISPRTETGMVYVSESISGTCVTGQAR
jgi:hypothetical protein